MVVHSFHIVTWQGGAPLFTKTWTETVKDPALLSELLANLEGMAKNLTSIAPSHIILGELQLIFHVDEANGLLFVFVTDVDAKVERWSEYLALLNKRFIEMFKNLLPSIIESERDEYQLSTFEQVVEKYVANWEVAEYGLLSAKVIDTLDLYSLFFNTILQKFLNEKMRLENWDTIGRIFQNQIAPNSPLSGLALHPDGNVFFDKINVENIDYTRMLKTLGRILRNLFALTQQLLSTETYQNLFFTHMIPLISSERDRLTTWELTSHLVMEIL